MAKSDEAQAREQRLAAKLRENLRRRKQQARARSAPPAEPESDEGKPSGQSGPETGSGN